MAKSPVLKGRDIHASLLSSAAAAAATAGRDDVALLPIQENH
jgi:hypothetical protein